MISFDMGYREIRAAAKKNTAAPDCFTIPAPAVGDGLIANIEETAQLLKNALVEHNITERSCSFVLPSGASVIREMKVPKIVQKDRMGYIRTQFAGMMEIQDQDIIDYIVTDKNQEEMQVLGILLPRLYVDQCVRMAKLAGLRCQKVDVRSNAIRRYLAKEPTGEENSYIVASLENGKAEINLFEKEKLFVRVLELTSQVQQGSDTFLKNWATSFNESLVVSSGQNAWTNSFAEELESIVNFQFTRNRALPVTHIYLCGAIDMAMKEEVERILQMPADFLCDEKTLPYAAAIGTNADVHLEQDIDLMRDYNQRTPEQKAKLKRTYILAGIIAAILVVEAAAWWLLGYADQKVAAETNQIQEYLLDKEVLSKTRKAEDTKKVLAEQKKYNEVLQSYSSAFDTVVRYSSTYLGGVNQQAQIYGITLEYSSYEEGTLSLTGYASDSAVAAQFAGALEANKIASNIAFEGYSKSFKDTASGYKFQLSGVVGEEGTHALK